MTIANGNLYPLRAEPYAQRSDRAADMQTPSARTKPWGENSLQPFETPESAASQGTQMFDRPYSLELSGNDQPASPLPYRPAQAPQGSQDAAPTAPQHAPAQLPQLAKLPGKEFQGKELPGSEQNKGEAAKTMEEIYEETHCSACESRRYQDGSDDPGVSFKFATKLNPYSATAAVRAHEYQHVRHHQMQADKQDRKIISQTVMLRTRRCPECGKMYTAGGTTKTVTAAYREQANVSGDEEGQRLNACV